MNETRLVKEVGIKQVKSMIADDCSEFTIHLPGDEWNSPSLILVGRLKQIVEAFELVGSYGGLKESKLFVQDYSNDASEIYDLKQAIKLVEQCNGR